MHGALTARIVPFPSGDTGTGNSRKGLEACSGQRVVPQPILIMLGRPDFEGLAGSVCRQQILYRLPAGLALLCDPSRERIAIAAILVESAFAWRERRRN